MALYSLMEELCFDREYLYLAFVAHFNALTREILGSGAVAQGGRYQIPGIKSGRGAALQ